VRRERIFYFAYDGNTPTGGEKHTYQHVDVLNDAGFDAYVLHSHKGVRHTWFENTTKIMDLASCWQVYDREHDYVVVPEMFGVDSLLLPGPHVIFNKNLYHAYGTLGLSRLARYPYTDENVVGIFSVSEHNLQHLRFAFPGAPIFRMYAHIDSDLFAFRPLADKKRRIVCVPKAREELVCLYQTLCARSAAGLNRLADYEWVFLENRSEAETARLMNESLIFVSLGTREGLPRAVLEAMASGCLVVAYGHGPLKECLPAEYAFESGDFIGAVTRIEELMAASPAELDSWSAVTTRARAIAEAYTRARQRQHLVEAWEAILSARR
jgi:hypothetical protein